jgi:hypothetical protein
MCVQGFFFVSFSVAVRDSRQEICNAEMAFCTYFFFQCVLLSFSILFSLLPLDAS